jgi:hypothetical protein
MATKIDSRFYNCECVCEKNIKTTTFFIQCKECIDPSPELIQMIKRGYECDCCETTITYNECICNEYREKIDLLKDELDHIIYFSNNMMNEIKHYNKCDDNLYRIKQISIEMRQLNRMLLENLVKKQSNN